MLSPMLTKTYGQSLAGAGPAYTAFAGVTVIACAGVVEFWSGRAQVWALLSDQLPRYKKTVHKEVTKFLARYRTARLECVVDQGNPVALAWAKRLGFSYESTMYSYTPDGRNHYMLTRHG